jgi:hypothetical protein
VIRLVLALLLFGLPCLPALAQEPARRDPSQEVAWIASQLAAGGGADLACVATHTSVNVIRDRAWIVSAYTGDLPVYESEYFVLSWIDGTLTGERLTGPGQTQVVQGEALSAYLDRVGLNTAPLETVFRRLYCDPAADDGG